MNYNPSSLERRVTFTYAVFGVLWILLSDFLISAIITNVQMREVVATYKGITFVVITACLLYQLLARETGKLSQTELSLRGSEQRYRALFNLVDEGIAINEAVLDEHGDVVDYIVLDANRAFEKHSPYKVQEALGRRATDLYQMSPEYIRTWWREHSPLQQAAHTEMYHEPSGRWFHIITTPREGKLFATLFTNITERKQAEESLRQSETRYQALVEQAADGIFITDMQGRYIDVNSSACAMLGYTREEILGADYRLILLPDDLAQDPPKLDLLRDGKTFLRERRYKRKDGTIFPIEINAKMLSDGRIQSIVRDITERKQNEEKLRRSLEQTVRAQRTLQALNLAAQAAQRAHMPHAIYQAVGEEVKKLGFDLVVYNLDEATRELSLAFITYGEELLRAAEKLTGVSAASYRFPVVAGGYYDRVLSSSKPILYTDLLDITRETLPPLLRPVANQISNLFGDTQGIYISMQVGGAPKSILVVLGSEIGEEDLPAVEALSLQISIALENARLYQDALTAGKRRAVLYRNSQMMVRVGQDVEQIYAAAHHAAAQLMPAEIFTIVLFDQKHQDLDAVYLFDRGGRSPSRRIPYGQGFSSKVIASGEALLIKDIEKSQLERIHFGTKESARSLVAVPMRVSDKVFGAISAQSYRADSYNDEDRDILEMLAAQIAIAVENVRLFENARQEIAERKYRERELEAIVIVSSSLRAASNRAEMFPIILDQLMSLMNLDGAAIALADLVSQDIVIELGRGIWAEAGGIRLKAGEGMSGQVIASGQPYITDNAINDPLLTHPPFNVTANAVACAPLIAQARIIGVVWIARTGHFNGEVRLLNAVSDIAATAIQRSALHEETEKRLERLAALRAIDLSITSTFDLKISLGILLDQVVAQLRVDAAAIYLYSSPLQTLTHAADRGFRTPGSARARLRLGDSHAGRTVLQRQMICIPDLAADPFSPSSEIAAEGFVSYYAVPLIAKGQTKGTLEVFHRTPLAADDEWLDFLQLLGGQAAIAIDNDMLFNNLQRSNVELTIAYDSTLEGWSRALDLRDRETEGHSRRVTQLTELLARTLGVDEAMLANIRRGALLHDIGKMGVPDAILLKNGPLDDEEWEIMKQHPHYAHELLLPIVYLRQSLDIPYCHHEKWDGSGYPRRLTGEQIPLAARIFAVADVYDALRSDRPYRQSWEKGKVVEFIQSQSGKHFDPKVVQVFLTVAADLE